MQTSINIRIAKSFAKHAAAKNDIRYYLNGVQIAARGGTMYYCATDGHKLAAAWHDTDAPDFEVIVPSDALAAVKIGKGECDEIQMTIEGNTVEITGAQINVRVQAMEGKFPDWLKIVPCKVSGELAQFNPDILAPIYDVVYDAFPVGKKQAAHLPILHYNGTSASVVQCPTVSNFIGLVMPWAAKFEEFPYQAPAALVAGPQRKTKKAA